MHDPGHIDIQSVRKVTSLLFSPFRLDYINECLWRANDRIELTPKAFSVLKRLVEAAGELVTKEQLLNSVWPETFVGDAVLKVCVGEIRRALKDECKSPRFIETLHRRGYRFIAPVSTNPLEAQVTAEASAGSAAPEIRTTGDPSVSQSTLPIPETHYARSGDVNIAYQVLGDGPIDLIFIMGWVSHLEYFWTEPSFARFLRRLASFSRLILLDKRGTGLSDRVPVSQLPTLEQRMDDVRAVMEAVGSKRAAICGISEGGIMSALFAATYPAKTLALIMIGTYAKRIRDASYPGAPLSPSENNSMRTFSIIGAARLAWRNERLRSRATRISRNGGPPIYAWASPGAALALTKMNTEIDVRHVLKNVRVPTLVLHRTGDRCLLVEEGRYVASLVPGARFVELPGIDHLPFVGDQNSVLDEVEQFLLGTRLPPVLDHVLATVLFVRFFQSGTKPGGAAQFVPPNVSDLLSIDLKREIEWFRGREVNLDGKGPLAFFDGPARAIRCACAIAERASWLGLEVAQGLHTGECERSGTDHSSLAVKITGAIANTAGPRGDCCLTHRARFSGGFGHRPHGAQHATGGRTLRTPVFVPRTAAV